MLVLAATLLLWSPLPATLPVPRGSGSTGDDRRAAAQRADALRADLRSSWPSSRRRAVRGFAELGEWEPVIDALADDEPEVADEAQLAIGAAADERLRATLLGREGLRSKHPWVRRRVAEAIGRWPGPVDGEALARLFDPRQAWTGRRLAWSVERLARRGALTGDAQKLAAALERCIGRQAAPELRASALSALAVVAPARALPALAQALAAREREPRVAALAAWVEVDAPGAQRAAVSALGDADPGVRLAALDALARLATRAACLALVERMGVEPRPRLARRLVDVLRGVTGLRHRDDPRPWRAWLEARAEDWRGLPHASRAPGEHGAAGGTVARFAGLPIVSDRVAILLDFSGSLWRERGAGVTRKEIVDEKLSQALALLPEETEFNLIPYTGRPEPWSEQLVPAQTTRVRQAMRWFERCNATGRGNVFDAVLLALTDARVDTLLVFTDGAPTEGPHWNLDLIVDLLLEETRYRGVAIDSIVVDAPPRLLRPWQRLAQGSGGRSLGVEFEQERDG